MKKLFVKHVDSSVLALTVSVLLTSAYNSKFWLTLASVIGGLSLTNLPILIGVFLIIVLFFNACLTLASFRHIAKPALIVLVLAASAGNYFITTYGIVIDKAMVQNVVETDLREATELFSWGFAAQIGLMGLVPSLLIIRMTIDFPSGMQGVLIRMGVATGSLLLAAIILMCLFKSLAPIVREHRELRFLLTPSNLIQASSGYFRNRWSTPLTIAPLGRDAVKGSAWSKKHRKTLAIIVVGETARAANFSLNGYSRITNPLLEKQEGLVNFSNVSSCGTATAVSVPCVFSALGRDAYSHSKAMGQEGLLDVLQHAGFEVIWRDNNSGCKGVCDRVKFEDLSQPGKLDIWCDGDECYDERLLDGLRELIGKSRSDLVVVLHQKGSHGPSYAKRYPSKFNKFGPVCTTNQFDSCSRESIVAAYDNTILYTDYFLSKTIDFLRGAADREGVDTAMLYFSDHGESLGENNIYLHGAPYIFAPREQTHVPMILWMSRQFSERFRIDRTCLNERRNQQLSHDNVFHSVLGMLGINTAVLNPRLDLFHSCIRRGSDEALRPALSQNS